MESLDTMVLDEAIKFLKGVMIDEELESHPYPFLRMKTEIQKKMPDVIKLLHYIKKCNQAEGKERLEKLKNMTSDERSLLLYFETRMVDYGGLIDVKHMNNVDRDIADKWNEEGFIKSGRIKAHSIIIFGHWCEFSEEAWKLAHLERRAKCKRIMSRQTIDKTCDR